MVAEREHKDIKLDDFYYCPLLKESIPIELCADICMAESGHLKRECVPEVSNWSEAEKVCPKCKHYF